MNIIVDLDYQIQDGSDVVFRSPVDCSQVTGLLVNHTGGSQEFMFSDAHGNNVGDIDHLFAENVAVKVILDVTTGMAFVQNADTNAYLESRFDGIIDKLCPSFTESGSAVRCEPVEGYPLTVEASEEATEIVRCGKNLFDVNNTSQYTTMNQGRWSVENDVLKVTGQGINATWQIKPSTTYTISYKSTRTGTSGGGVYVRSYNADNTSTLLDNKHTASLSASFSVTTPDDAVSLNILFYGTGSNTDHTNYALFSEIQVEVGNTATAYEPYECNTFAPNEPITALKGVNTLYADSGEITVTGKADPVAIIEKLSSTVTAMLGG